MVRSAARPIGVPKCLRTEKTGTRYRGTGLIQDDGGACTHDAVTMSDRAKTLVERLFAEHRAALEAFFQRRIRTKSDAPDMAQEVYLRMLRVSDADAIRNPELYLYTVANNLVKEHAVLDRRQSSAIDVHDTTVQQQLAELPAFDADLDATQRMTRLREVLAQLRPTHRAAVVLHYRDGLSYAEIAGRLGVSSHMVKKYLSQSLLHCRRRMARLG